MDKTDRAGIVRMGGRASEGGTARSKAGLAEMKILWRGRKEDGATEAEVQGVSASFTSRVGQEGSVGSRMWALVWRQLSKWHIWLRGTGRSGGKEQEEEGKQGLRPSPGRRPPSKVCVAGEGHGGCPACTDPHC